MKAKKIKDINDWLELKSFCNILVFLDFTNFYWHFIQGFNRIAALLTSMLKTTRLPEEPAPSKNNGSRSAFSRNDNNKPAFEKNDGKGKIDGFGVSGNSVEYAKKSGKLSMSRKSSK